jgi:hypothetical protein
MKQDITTDFLVYILEFYRFTREHITRNESKNPRTLSTGIVNVKGLLLNSNGLEIGRIQHWL